LIFCGFLSVSSLADRAIVIGQNQLRDLEEALRSREREEPERKRLEQQRKDAEDQKKKEEEARLEQEEARLAPVCVPLTNRALSALSQAGGDRVAFEQARQTLHDIRNQLPTSCPDRVEIFDNSIVTLYPCYNQAVFVELADGRRLVWTQGTRTFGHGLPQRIGEWMIGITDAYYFCIKSTAPLVVWPGKQIRAAVRRK
jgi:hypothetical protein